MFFALFLACSTEVEALEQASSSAYKSESSPSNNAQQVDTQKTEYGALPKIQGFTLHMIQGTPVYFESKALQNHKEESQKALEERLLSSREGGSRCEQGAR